jgi:uncharacterized RDD family membrane protein YckC
MENYAIDTPQIEDIDDKRASKGQRFANYLIDLISFYVVIFILGMVLGLVAPDVIDSYDPDAPGADLLDRLITLLFYALYMGTIESIFNGKSFGKFVTGTRAVNLDGSQISKGTAFKRGFSRAVPFCVFSALGTPCDPWQDRWTDTAVVVER